MRLRLREFFVASTGCLFWAAAADFLRQWNDLISLREIPSLKLKFAAQVETVTLLDW